MIKALNHSYKPAGLHEPEWELTTTDMRQIADDNDTVLEMIAQAYKLGYNRAKARNNVPMLNIPMMSDERWNELAAKMKQ
ncbi:hypothetical protein [Clostridium sp. M62/1]|uniref:hypothetical protein n=1 Tax=Clostridium sp. M62/1 TaxID=411486 RepID=UPI003561E80D